MNFNKVVIYGWKLHTHTHSYINYGFFRAFKELGYDVIWLDDTDNTSHINFDNCLFMVEGQIDKNLPHNKNSKYVLHNCDGSKYLDIDKSNKVSLQFFHKDVLKYNLNKINSYTYVGEDAIYQPWATDLLPREINLDEARNMSSGDCLWVGSYSPNDRTAFENNTELDPFFNAARAHGIKIKHIDPWSAPVSPEENRKLVNQAYVAPAINGVFQKNTYYVPCRIFKNISYGHLGITNNSFVNDMFDGKLVYDNDTSKLFQKVIEKKSQSTCLDEIKFLMNEVRNKHTFINRAQIILDFFA